MTPSDEKDNLEEPFADVIGPLRRLGEAIDRERCPGRAWPVRLTPRRRPVLRILAASAAAAAILLAAAAARWIAPRSADDPQPPAGPQVAATAPAEPRAVDWSVPTAIDPSVASRVTWSMLSASASATTADPNGPGWSVPRISFPSFGPRAAETPSRATSQPASTQSSGDPLPHPEEKECSA